MGEYVELPDADTREAWTEIVDVDEQLGTCPKCGLASATRATAVYGQGLEVVVAERRIRCTRPSCGFFSGEPIKPPWLTRPAP